MHRAIPIMAHNHAPKIVIEQLSRYASQIRESMQMTANEPDLLQRRGKAQIHRP